MKKIVFFIDSLGGGGAERVVANLSNQLAQSGKHRISIVMLLENGQLFLSCCQQNFFPINEISGDIYYEKDIFNFHRCGGG